MSTNDPFREEYDRAVAFEATLILRDLKITAADSHYEPDLFVNDVLAKVHKFKRKEWEDT